MNPLYNEPLTDEERRFAEEHYEVISFHLRQCQRWSDDDLAYDCIITGFLCAVKKYFAREELRQYEFRTICEYAIKTRLGNLWVSQRGKAAHLQQVAPVTQTDDGEFDFIDNALDESDQFETVYDNDYFDRIANTLKDDEKEIFYLLLHGYSRAEISRVMNRQRLYIYRKAKTIREKIRSEVLSELHV